MVSLWCFAFGFFECLLLIRSDCRQSVISIPMLRAVPAITREAVSSDEEFMSLNLILAISSTWAFVTLPTLSVLGLAAPLAIWAACLSKTAAGGLLVMNSNERSL